ncbi:MAG: hypothetical protein FJY66_03905 [Calditrichaeota bacterium]|nr:hypothetical protein [Calditrichota bacterium]
MNSLLKSLITFIFLATITTIASSQSRQTQAILDAWDREVVVEIFADTITSNAQYSDTIDIGRWAGSPRNFALFAELDSVGGATDDIDLTAIFDLALESNGPFYVHADETHNIIPLFPALNSTGYYVFDVNPYGGNHIRFSFSCSDTLYLRAFLWMKH